MILSARAAFITIKNSCYFIVNIFLRGESSKLLLYCLYAALFCCAEWHMCVLCRLTVYFMGGQLVIDWDRLENLLITRYRLVGNIVTNSKCQS